MRFFASLNMTNKMHRPSVARFDHRILALGLVVALLALLWAAETEAAPVYSEAVLLRQPDGTVFQAIPFGDEWANGLRTLHGHLITQDKLSYQWVYARPKADGRLEPSDRVVGRDQPPLEALRPLSRPQAQERKATPRPAPTLSSSTTGTQPVLVILVEFADQAPVGTTAADWAERLFGASRSARDYYREVSYGQLLLAPATEAHGAANNGIVGWLKLSQLHPNTQGAVGVANADLTRAALQAADEFVDFASFDRDANEILTTSELHIVIVVAGYDASFGGATSCTPSIWAHQTGFGGDAPALDNVKIGDFTRGGGYVQLGEWHCSQNDTPGHPATLGVLVHELGHNIGRGAPDLYDGDGSSHGIGKWCVMASGAWNQTDLPGDTPAHFSAWVKALFGWVTPEMIRSGERQLSITPVTQELQVFQLLDNPGGIDWNWGTNALGEYFLVENRQKAGYDVALPGAGLLIWYIDESQPDNDDEARRLVDLLEADGQNNLKCRGGPNCNRGDEGDPFPGVTNNRSFGDQTTPNSKLRNGFATGIELSDILVNGGQVTMRVRITQSTPGNLVLLSDSFDDAPNGEWVVTAPWALRPAGECQQAPPPVTTGQNWYYGAPESCQYTPGGRLYSPVIGIPPGATRLTVRFSTLLQLQPGDRAEIRAYFNGDRERLIFRRRTTKGWTDSFIRVRVPRGASEIQLEFVVRSRSAGRARQAPAAYVGWWVDNIEVRTEPSRSASSAAAPGYETEEITESGEAVLIEASAASGVLEILVRRPGAVRMLQLEVFDLTGRRVSLQKTADRRLLYWGQDHHGRRLANGVYLYVVTVLTEDGRRFRTEVRKLLLQR